MKNPIFQTFHHQIEAFKQWSSRLIAKHGGWETDYLHWDTIYESVEGFLQHTSLDEWSTEVYELLLYTIARDNEVENVLQLLIEKPKVLIALAYKAITYHDYEARWQIAYGLGEIDCNQEEVSELLSKYINDEHEYVRRRALFALQKTNLGNT
jgi:hypothetical protein